MDVSNVFLHSELDEEIFMSCLKDMFLLLDIFLLIRFAVFISPSMDSSRRRVNGTSVYLLCLFQLVTLNLQLITHYS